MNNSIKFATSALALGVGLALSAPAYAGGFYIQEQSTKEAGRAYSGDAAAADSAATVFFNPAGMTELEGITIEANAQALFAAPMAAIISGIPIVSMPGSGSTSPATLLGIRTVAGPSPWCGSRTSARVRKP